MATIHVALGPRSYSIEIGRGQTDLPAWVQSIAPRRSRTLVVADSNTRAHAEEIARQLEANLAIVPAGEASKSQAELGRLYSVLAAMPADRKSPVVAVGGGVIGDLAGFAAATYNRGIPLIMVPTTLLAMVDSSVGGKVGINLPEGKNLVGSFHQPAGVWIDTRYLNTLPDREYRSGLAEVVKYGVIMDADFFAWLEQHSSAILNREPTAIEHMVARSCRLKADVVEQDEHEEHGLRMILNYGHTFAHAFESTGGYGSWLHGEAVSAGMVCAARLAEMHGLLAGDLSARQLALLSAFGLPTRRLSNWSIDDMLAVMRRDKKNVGGRMRFILPTRLGHVAAHDDVPEALARAVLEG